MSRSRASGWRISRGKGRGGAPRPRHWPRLRKGRPGGQRSIGRPARPTSGQPEARGPDRRPQARVCRVSLRSLYGALVYFQQARSYPNRRVSEACPGEVALNPGHAREGDEPREPTLRRPSSEGRPGSRKRARRRQPERPSRQASERRTPGPRDREPKPGHYTTD